MQYPDKLVARAVVVGRRAVQAAMLGNLGVAGAKLSAWATTGSAALLAEAEALFAWGVIQESSSQLCLRTRSEEALLRRIAA